MFEELLGKIGRELDSRGIPYMIIGGQAVLLYGEPRLTRDIDVTLGMGEEERDIIREVPSVPRSRRPVQDRGTPPHDGETPSMVNGARALTPWGHILRPGPGEEK